MYLFIFYLSIYLPGYLFICLPVYLFIYLFILLFSILVIRFIITFLHVHHLYPAPLRSPLPSTHLPVQPWPRPYCLLSLHSNHVVFLCVIPHTYTLVSWPGTSLCAFLVCCVVSFILILSLYPAWSRISSSLLKNYYDQEGFHILSWVILCMYTFDINPDSFIYGFRKFRPGGIPNHRLICTLNPTLTIQITVCAGKGANDDEYICYKFTYLGFFDIHTFSDRNWVFMHIHYAYSWPLSANILLCDCLFLLSA